MRIAFVILAVLLAGCGGSDKLSAQSVANVSLLNRAPVYPGARAPRTTSGDAFASRDWTLPAGTSASRVIDWYVTRLQARGWKVLGKSFDTIRAKRLGATLSVGVRARTLEVIASGPS